jgi:hypothetical protein
MVSLKNVNASLGKFVRKNSQDPIGVCDYSGFIFSKSDLHKQYEWVGNRLQWTGFFVGKEFLDKPNEQLRPPKIKNDPKTVLNARPILDGEDVSKIGADVRLSRLNNVTFK